MCISLIIFLHFFLGDWTTGIRWTGLSRICFKSLERSLQLTAEADRRLAQIKGVTSPFQSCQLSQNPVSNYSKNPTSYSIAKSLIHPLKPYDEVGYLFYKPNTRCILDLKRMAARPPAIDATANTLCDFNLAIQIC